MADTIPSSALRAGEAATFLLLAAEADALPGGSELENRLRRMGLAPETPAAVSDDFAALCSGQIWQIRFGTRAYLVSHAHAVGEAGRQAGAEHQVAMLDHSGVTGSEDRLILAPIAKPEIDDAIAATRPLLRVAVLLADMIAADHVYWSPANLWSRVPMFRAAVTEMLESGMPPLLHVVAFLGQSRDSVLSTRGLAFFCGQELRLIDAGAHSQAEQMRRFARLALDLMMHGSMAGRRRFPGLVAGETICVEPGDKNVPPMLLDVRFEFS